jgi:hypothetical protein
MSDLKADTQRIHECSDALQRIYNQFTSRANPADGYSDSELGSPLIGGTFHDFADNWKIHRQQLADKIETLGTITQDAADTYESVDGSLADALRKYDASQK